MYTPTITNIINPAKENPPALKFALPFIVLQRFVAQVTQPFEEQELLLQPLTVVDIEFFARNNFFYNEISKKNRSNLLVVSL